MKLLPLPTILLLGAFALASAHADVPARALKICDAENAPAPIQQAARSVLAAADSQPLLKLMAGSDPPTSLTDTAALLAAPPTDRAYNYLVIIGLPTDPMIQQVWQNEARAGGGGFYIFGFGHLNGDIGYIESDRNPYLHGAAIKTAPFETEIVTITGSTPAGVALAAQAFIKEGLINGVVGAPGWNRGETTLLDRDPLKPDFALPSVIPPRAGDAEQVGVTEPGENEYRGVLATAGVEPQVIWRVKYDTPGAWDGPGIASAVIDYTNGLQRRAYGNTLWCARFANAAEAGAAAAKIAAAADMHSLGKGVYHGAQSQIPGQKQDLPLALWTDGDWVLMSTLPSADTQAIEGALPK